MSLPPLLTCMYGCICISKWKWKLLSRVRLFVIPWNIQSMEFSRPDPFSRGSSQPRSPALRANSLLSKPPGMTKNSGVGNLSLLQGIFPTQGWNRGLLRCRQVLYQLSYQGSPCVSEVKFKPTIRERYKLVIVKGKIYCSHL